MWTRKASVLFGMGLFLLFTGLLRIQWSGVAILWGSRATATMGLSVLSMLAICYLTVRADLRLTHQISTGEVLEGDTFDVVLRVVAHGPVLARVELSVQLPAEMKVVSGSSVGNALLSGKKRSLTSNMTVWAPVRGYYALGPITVRVYDPLSLFYEVIVLEHREIVTVHPVPRPVHDRLPASRALLHPGPRRSRIHGQGTDFFHIREYRHSDPFNIINWKASARTGQLMVNEHEKEETKRVVLFVDSRGVMGAGTVYSSPMEWAVSVALHLAEMYSRRGFRVGLVTYGRGVFALPMGSGHQALSAIRSHLTGTYARGGKSLYKAVSVAAPGIPAGTHVVLISSLEGDHTVPDAVRELRQRSATVSVITLPGHIVERKRVQETDMGGRVTLLAAAVERALIVLRLRASGVQVTECTVPERLESLPEYGEKTVPVAGEGAV